MKSLAWYVPRYEEGEIRMKRLLIQSRPEEHADAILVREFPYSVRYAGTDKAVCTLSIWAISKVEAMRYAEKALLGMTIISCDKDF